MAAAIAARITTAWARSPVRGRRDGAARSRGRGARAPRRPPRGSRRPGRDGDRGSRPPARPTRRRRSTALIGVSSSLSPKFSRSDANASRECTVRMSAMLKTTPSHWRSGFRLSRASSMTSSACSTPWSAKYCASAREQRVVGGDERVDGEQPEGGRAVDEDEVVAAVDRSRSARRSVSSRPIFPPSASSVSASVEVGRDDAVVDRVGGLGAARRARRRWSAPRPAATSK